MPRQQRRVTWLHPPSSLSSSSSSHCTRLVSHSPSPPLTYLRAPSHNAYTRLPQQQQLLGLALNCSHLVFSLPSLLLSPSPSHTVTCCSLSAPSLPKPASQPQIVLTPVSVSIVVLLSYHCHVFTTIQPTAAHVSQHTLSHC